MELHTLRYELVTLGLLIASYVVYLLLNRGAEKKEPRLAVSPTPKPIASNWNAKLLLLEKQLLEQTDSVQRLISEKKLVERELLLARLEIERLSQQPSSPAVVPDVLRARVGDLEERLEKSRELELQAVEQMKSLHEEAERLRREEELEKNSPRDLLAEFRKPKV